MKHKDVKDIRVIDTLVIKVNILKLALNNLLGKF